MKKYKEFGTSETTKQIGADEVVKLNDGDWSNNKLVLSKNSSGKVQITENLEGTKFGRKLIKILEESCDIQPALKSEEKNNWEIVNGEAILRRTKTKEMKHKPKMTEELEVAGNRETSEHCFGGSCGGDEVCACDCSICLE